jgi:hypothetical protein
VLGVSPDISRNKQSASMLSGGAAHHAPSLGPNPTAQFNDGGGSSPVLEDSPSKPRAAPLTTDEANARLKADLAQLIERLEQALAKFKERKDKLRQHQSLLNPVPLAHSELLNDPVFAQRERDLRNAQLRLLAVKKDIGRLRQTLE